MLGAQTGKFRAARGVEAFLERHRLLQKLHRFAGFAQMHFGSGKEIESRSAVNVGRKQFFDGSDLGANLHGVIRLGGSAANFVFFLPLRFFLLSSQQVCCGQNQRKRDCETRDKNARLHLSRLDAEPRRFGQPCRQPFRLDEPNATSEPAGFRRPPPPDPGPARPASRQAAESASSE
jgi:hypothetical protein